MGGISIHVDMQNTTATGSVLRNSTVSVPGGPAPAPAAVYWLGVKLQATQSISQLTIAGNRIVPGHAANANVKRSLYAAYPPGSGVWRGFEISGSLLPANPAGTFNTVFELKNPSAADQGVEWRVAKKPGPFNKPGVPEAGESATIPH